MRALERAISLIKGRPTNLDASVSAGYLFWTVLDKAVSLMRGLIFSRRAIFLGRKSKIRAPGQLYCGRGVEFGGFCEIDCLSSEGLMVGAGTKIGSFSIVKVSGTLSDLGKGIVIGSNVGIGEFAHIGGAGGVHIGDDTIVGAFLSIHPENHIYSDIELPIRKQGVSRRGIKIGSNCWIGAKVTFLDGSSIGDGCVVAAGAVVTGAYPDNVVIGGVPSRIIKSRNKAGA